MAQLLTPERTACRLPGVSKKRLFESLARIISEDQSCLPYELVFSQLVSREKLGSTGLGQGIAIPHCRVDNCSQAIGVLITLEEAIDFDAPDNRGVDLIFALLVPGEAHQQHLDTLAEIARKFSDENFCQQLRNATSAEELYSIANA